jgi:ATP-dependent DNA ligase
MIEKYLAPSSRGNDDYIVTLQSDKGDIWSASNCTCTGWRYRHDCRHAKAVQSNPAAYKKYKVGKSEATSHVVQGKEATGKFRKPMLAGSIDNPKHLDFKSTHWAVEEKFDGHRLVVSVQNGKVIAWARSGKIRPLPNHLRKAMELFPTGLYDGELCIPHGRSYNVTEVERAGDRCYVIFDLIEVIHRDCTDESYDRRREMLKMIFAAAGRPPCVQLAESTNVKSWKDVEELCGEIWERDGEGVILKDRKAKYESRRTKTFLKVKQLRTAVLVCTGFKEGKLGPCSKIQMRDDDGNTTSAKVRNMKWLAEIQKSPKRFVGRKVRIDYQERTPDGGYRHPRMDRWEDQ